MIPEKQEAVPDCYLMQKAKYLSAIDQIAMVEEFSGYIQFVNPQNWQYQKELKVSLDSTESKNKVKLVVMTFINFQYQGKELLLVATDDSKIRSFEYNSNNSSFQSINPLPTDPESDKSIQVLEAKAGSPQYCMAWDEIQNLLYTGDKEGNIQVWNLHQKDPYFTLGQPVSERPYAGRGKSDLEGDETKPFA